jgi:ribosome-interacting GTPase 1
MPTNVSPEFKKAQTAFRRARDPEERLPLLKEMLRLIPKHKGTEHLQGEIKSKIKELTEELTGPKKGGGRGGPPTTFRPEGAAQVALIGPPNSGKSAIHARLTGSHSPSEAYPFATQYPQPGMFAHEDAVFQLIDVPSISSQHPIPWLSNTLQTPEACLLIVDLSQPGCVEALIEVVGLLRERRINLTADWPYGEGVGTASQADEDMFAVNLPTLLVANKADLIEDPAGELEVLEELGGVDYPTIAVSALTGAGLEDLGAWLFDHLGIVRVYTKLPGKPPDGSAPFTIRRGETVADVVEQVHRDIAKKLKYARVWGRDSFDGQQVGRDHVLVDGDVLELH